MTTPSAPTIIWVVGDNTSVGKTTVSAALVRTLNAQGIPTVGFKPYAGARLIDVIDVLEQDCTADGCLVGRDARKLGEASPLITPALLEVINPSWRITHPLRDVSVFIRKGALAIGQRHFMCTRNALPLWRRPDFQRLKQSVGLPVDLLAPLADAPADEVDLLNQEVQEASYRYLLQLQPAIMVCEGAGRLLPLWRGAPPVRHLLYVATGNVHFFRNLALNLNHHLADERLSPMTVGHIAQQLKARQHVQAAIPVVPHSVLDSEMDLFMRRFVPLCS